SCSYDISSTPLTTSAQGTGMSTLIKRIDHGDIRELRLDRAPVNALNPAVCAQLVEAIGESVAEGAGGIVLSGGPKVFSAGLDVPFLLSLPDRDALKAAWEQFFLAARELARGPGPVAAALDGHAPAGGCVLALGCDHRRSEAGRGG